MKRLVLVDGNALLHRAYHATPPLTTSKGELVNATYGFTSLLFRSISELKPDYIAVAWDKSDPTFRHQAYTQYKSTRRPMEDGLSGQYERVHEIVDALNIPEFSLSGYEADDLIGTLARQAEKEKDLEIIVVTGDKDIMQLIDKNIKVLMPKKTLSDVGLYGEEEFAARFGFKPLQLIDYKGLAGDASDNIPGVPGIGEVSATKLIQKFESVENIYRPENLQTLPERMQKLLAEGAEDAVMSKQLATIETSAPIRLELNKCVVQDFDREKVKALFEELEFKSLIARIPGSESLESRIKSQEENKSSNPRLLTLATSPLFTTTDLDLEVTPVLEQMTKNGVLIDLPFLERFGDDIKARLVDIEKQIYSYIGHEINLNSPKQLSQVLFDELKLPVFRKTKTGRSTDEETLQQLKAAHPAIPLILEYRQLFKLISTYVDALPKYVGSDGRVHSTFNVEGAASGRLSSTNPNLQNIPIKGDLGGEMRKAFIAPPGKVLLAADYSQVELRILAHISQDPDLKKAFQDKLDIHAATAAKIFKIPVDQITKQQRMIGKTMNFATLYGQGPHALSRQLGIEYAGAKEYIEEYFAQFPKVKEWMAKVLVEGREKGYVETIWGRKRYMPELTSQNHMLRSAGERAAINHPIQGTSADMIKKAMVLIAQELPGFSYQFSDLGQSVVSSSVTDKQKTGKLKSENRPPKTDNGKLILQVHDELLFECDPEEVEETARMVKEKMEQAIELSVPVIVDLKVGPNWGEMEKLQIR